MRQHPTCTVCGMKMVGIPWEPSYVFCVWCWTSLASLKVDDGFLKGVSGGFLKGGTLWLFQRGRQTLIVWHPDKAPNVKKHQYGAAAGSGDSSCFGFYIDSFQCLHEHSHTNIRMYKWYNRSLNNVCVFNIPQRIEVCWILTMTIQ